MTSAKEMITRAFSQRHFMSPLVIRYGKINNNVSYELSRGYGLYNHDVFGVTVVSERNNVIKKEHDLTQAFLSLSEAEDYIRTLKKNDRVKIE